MPATDTTSRVLVLGYGEMGHAMETLLGARHRLTIWQRRPPPGRHPVALEAQAPDSDFILFCLPATAHAPLAARLRPVLGQHTLCLTIAKGLDDAGQTPAEALTGAFGRTAVTVAYGPMIAEEIRAGKAAYAQCSASSNSAYQRIAALFNGSALRLEPSDDVIGLSWSAILKNVYAIAFGLADALGLGDNVRGYLTVTALHELDAIVRALGGAPATPFHLAGLGDLVTTATSAGSHHHALGRRLARGEHGLTGEGIHTLTALRTRPRFDAVRHRLFRLIDACVQDPDGAAARFRDALRSHDA